MDDLETRPGPWAGEMGALLLQTRLIASGLRRPRERAEADRVVVFVHGFMAAGPVFDPMRQHVRDATGLPGLDFTYSSLSTFGSAVRRLAGFIEEQAPAHARLCMVGHSLGGLMSRWYVQEMGGWQRVDRLVTIATPHAGTARAGKLPLPLLLALRPGGDVVRRLEERAHLLDAIPHTVVAAGRDRMVHPTDSAAAVPRGELVWLDDVGHNEVLYDARAHQAVARALG